MGKNVIFISTLIAATSVITGCNTSGCLENRSAIPLAEFYSSATKEIAAFDSIEIRGIGAPADSILSPAGSAISQLYLPMRSAKEQIEWCFAYRWKALDYPELYDTIKIEYTSSPYFASEECGVIYRYHVNRLKTTYHLIDSVTIADSLITNVDKVYFKIYFRTSDEDQESADEGEGEEVVEE